MDDCVLVEGTARNSATFRTHRIFQRFGVLAGRTVVSRARWKRSPSREEAVSRCRKSTDLVASYGGEGICQDAFGSIMNVKTRLSRAVAGWRKQVRTSRATSQLRLVVSEILSV